MIILGLNAFHADSSAALVRDGKLLAAAEEERFRRIKHWAGFPSQAIQYCLCEAKVDLGEVTHVAVNRNSRANLLRKLRYVAFHRPNVGLRVSGCAIGNKWLASPTSSGLCPAGHLPEKSNTSNTIW